MKASRQLFNKNSSNRLLKDVFSTVKESGWPEFSKEPMVTTEDKFLVYRSYNPSLKKEDFQNLIPFSSDSHKAAMLKKSFDVFMYRDARLFTFLDRYILKFSTNLLLKDYLMSSRMNVLDDRKVKFSTKDLKVVQSTVTEYYRNLNNASMSEDQYYNEVDSPVSDTAVVDWDRLKSIEHKSVVVWNLPSAWDAMEMQRQFWWYDIHHSFHLFVNEERNTRLTYIYFNEVRDAFLFKNNYHGSLLENSRLLIEKL